MRKFLGQWWLDALILLVLIGAGLASHFWWLWHHHIPPEADYGLHLSEAAAFQAVIESPGDFLEKLVTVWTWPGPYPQVVYFVTWVFTWVLPGGSYAALASLSLYLACLVVGAYVLGSTAGGRPVGAAAALLAQSDPILLSSVRHYWVDTPVAAMVVLSLALLVQTRTFTSRPWTLAFGACLALGMMTKVTLCWFLTLPLLLTMVGPLRDANRPGRLWFLGLLGALAGIFQMLCAWSLADGGVYQAGKDTMAPVLSYWLLATWLVACALYWGVVSRRLAGPLRHLSHAFCLAGILLGPWILANQAMIKERWKPATDLIPKNLAEIQTSLAPVAQLNIQVVLWAGLLGLLVIPFLKSRWPVLIPVLLAFVTGTAVTVILLGPSVRYMAPSQALLCVMAVCWLPRTLFVSLPVLALSICLASVNLFTDMAQARAPEVGRFLDRYSLYTRRSIADQSQFPWTDFEPFSHALLAHLGPSTSSIYILSRPDETVRLYDLYYLLAAEGCWRGNVVACRLIGMFEERTEYLRLCLLEPDRTRMLARRRGLPLERFPHAFNQDAFTPEIVLMTLPADQPETVARSIFGASYQREPFPPEYGFVVLRCAGAYGAKPSAPGPERTDDPAYGNEPPPPE